MGMTMNHYKNIRGVTKALKAVRGEAEKKIRIAIIAEPQVEADVLRNLQVIGPNKAVFGISSLTDDATKRDRLKEADLALVVISPGKSNDDLKAMVGDAQLAKEKLVVITGREINDWLAGNLADVFRVSDEDVLFVPVSDEKAIQLILVPRIIKKMEGKEIALAAAVPVFKEEVTQQIIMQTAKQNAVIGLAVFIPGADMPLLTMNQIKMVLRLSAVYNEELSAKRLYEVLAVVGGGFALREAARQTLGAIPVAGWAIKGGIAYGGTIAVGRLAKKYFERVKGENVESLATDREDTTERGEAEPLYK